MKKDLYDTLGVDKKATDEEIKSAFKNKAKDVHPDKPGGSTEKMQELVHALDILKSKHRRDRYDKTGQEDDKPFERKFNDVINNLFMAGVDATDLEILEKIDIVEEFRIGIKKLLEDARENQNKMTLRADKLKRVKNRLKSKGNTQIIHMLNIHTSDSEMFRERVEYDIKFYDQCLLVLNDYNYTFDPPPPQPEYIITNSNYYTL